MTYAHCLVHVSLSELVLFFLVQRVGYLGLMLLLDERQEVLMLVTNSLKNDLNSQDQYVIGLALTALGNICSSEMARDLSPEVDRLLASPNPYIRKKAALCARRIVHKMPDMMEAFVDRAMEQLHERNHAVVLTGVTLMIDIATAEKLFRAVIAQSAPLLCRILKVLVSGGFAAEYDVNGVSDPYLQVKILHLLRLLSENDESLGDSISDILAQVATNVDNNKPAGNAVLYECVKTIMAVKGIGGLRVLAVNTLGRFLGYRDNNMRYISLSLLLNTISEDPQAMQRHKSVVLECVRDDDDSIRRKALDLVFALVNPGNAKEIVQELIEYLKICDKSFREELADKTCILIQKLSMDPSWYINSMLNILVECGEYVSEDACRSLIITILNAKDLHQYAADKYITAWQDCKEDSNAALTQVSLWLCGEYIQADKVPVFIELAEKVTNDSNLPQSCHSYALIALGKVCARTKSSDDREKIYSIVSKMNKSISIESQNRSMEITCLYPHKTTYDSVFGPIPALEGMDEVADPASSVDLQDQESSVDLTKLLGIDEATQASTSIFEAYRDETIKIDVQFFDSNCDDNSTIHFSAKYYNQTDATMEEFRVQAAVPKHMKLRLEAASAGKIAPHSSPVTQKMWIVTHGSDKVVMKIRLMYVSKGQKVVKVVEVAFPKTP